MCGRECGQGPVAPFDRGPRGAEAQRRGGPAAGDDQGGGHDAAPAAMGTARVSGALSQMAMRRPSSVRTITPVGRGQARPAAYTSLAVWAVAVARCQQAEQGMRAMTVASPVNAERSTKRFSAMATHTRVPR